MVIVTQREKNSIKAKTNKKINNLKKTEYKKHIIYIWEVKFNDNNYFNTIYHAGVCEKIENLTFVPVCYTREEVLKEAKDFIDLLENLDAV